MRITQRVCTLVAVVRLPVIMTQNPFERRQGSHLIHRLGAPLGVRVEKGQRGIGSAVEPVAFSTYVDAGLIGMNKIRLGQLSLYPLLEGVQLFVGLVIEIKKRSGADRNTHLFLKVVSDSVIGKQLEL